jgi:phage terminase large subunit-like protein
MDNSILNGKKSGKKVKLVPASKGHKPKGAHGRAAVKELGRTKTTGNFKRIEAAKGKGAAIAAFQNAKKAHEGK